MKIRSNVRLYRGLAALGAATFLEVAHADPCEATAILSGEPSLVAELSGLLMQRSISLQGSPGCAAIVATISSQGGKLVIVLQDTSNKSETFQVAEMATAASLIEAWSRVALEPILPPGIEASAASALDVTPAPLATQNTMPQYLDPYAPLTVQTEPHARFSRLHRLSQLTQAKETPVNAGFKSVDVSAEYLPGGWISNVASGRGVKLSLNLAQFKKFNLSAEGRGHQKTSGDNDGFFFNTFYTPADPLDAKTLFQGVDLMLRVARPLTFRRLSLVPSAAAGAGFHMSTDLISNLNIPEETAIRLMVDGQMGLEYRLTKRLEIQTYYSMSAALSNSATSFSKDASTPSLNPMPSIYERVGAGLSFHY
jgi:hypothetical protein